METIFNWFLSHAAHAHYIIFGLLILKGFHIPMSEKILALIAGVMASSFVPAYTVHLIVAIVTGCYIADWITYWLGRLVGSKMYHLPVLRRVLHEENQGKILRFYEKYGLVTIILGHFTPFGIRNGIFMAAGIGRMGLLKFGLINVLGCLIFTLAFFGSAYWCGQNYHMILEFIHKADVVLVLLAFVGCCGAVIWYKRKARTSPV